MKKDKKFLSDLENELHGINKANKDAIILKYKNIIEEELNKKRRIKAIIKELGDPKEIAKKEKKELKKDKKVFEVVKCTLSQFIKKIITFIKKIITFITKDRQIKINKKKKSEKNLKKLKIRKENFIKNKLKSIFKKKSKNEKEKKTKKESKKINFAKLKNITKIFKKKKEKTVVNKIIDTVDETTDEVIEEVNEVVEKIVEVPVFITKKEKTKRIIFKTIGVIGLILLFLLWLWINVIFVACLIGFLDGIKFYGINIAIFGIDILVLIFILMLSKLIFQRKNKFKYNLIVIIISVLITAIGIGKSINEFSKITIESDVSQKYTMTTKYDTYNLPSNNENMYITFNSNYDTQYIIKHDKNLNGKVKIEVKYYENYYDYYVKKSSNNVYVSLGTNSRDRISSYIDDLKENKIYKNDELSRYTVKITINEKDEKRLIIN